MKQASIERLRAQRQRLTQAIAKLSAEESRRVRARALKKIRRTIRACGGKEAFIERFGRGLLIDAYSWAGPSRCAAALGCERELHTDVCAFLGVPPNRWTWRCINTGKYERDGHKYCSKHRLTGEPLEFIEDECACEKATMTPKETE